MPRECWNHPATSYFRRINQATFIILQATTFQHIPQLNPLTAGSHCIDAVGYDTPIL
jgi:hypothetical protein